MLIEKLVPTAGQTVAGRYILREQVGRGGFGVVFRATQIGLDEDVAVKVLRPHIVTNQTMYSRFEREVKIAKGLRHPNSIRVLDFDKTEEGLPFYVMEFLRGDSLSAILRQEGGLSPHRARRIMIQVLKSLAEAHSRGVVHRDLKPSNVMLTEVYGETDFVKVLDFGIAKAISELDENGDETRTGEVLGTPRYMSPEQARSEAVDGRSDIYTAGLLIAECIGGKPLVQGQNHLDLLFQHTSPTPLVIPPSIISSPLSDVIRVATRKQKERRYQTAEEMVDALESLGELPNDVPRHLVPLPREVRLRFGDSTPTPTNSGHTPPSVPLSNAEAIRKRSQRVAGPVAAGVINDAKTIPVSVPIASVRPDHQVGRPSSTAETLALGLESSQPRVPTEETVASIPSVVDQTAPSSQSIDATREPPRANKGVLFVALAVILVAAGALAMFFGPGDLSDSADQEMPEQSARVTSVNEDEARVVANTGGSASESGNVASQPDPDAALQARLEAERVALDRLRIERALALCSVS
ncbi:MAG: protein kinase, partial [Myxococcales bacterium]|nr:protein kinase [Myxococcales bacterium]